MPSNWYLSSIGNKQLYLQNTQPRFNRIFVPADCQYGGINATYEFQLDSINFGLTYSIRWHNSNNLYHLGQESDKGLDDENYDNYSILLYEKNIKNLNISNTMPTSDSIQIYFKPQMVINGTNYSDVAVNYFNLTDTALHVEKMFVAPSVGPVRVEMSDGQTFDLDSTDAAIAPYEYFKR